MMMGIAKLWGDNWVIVEYSQHSAVLVFRKIFRITIPNVWRQTFMRDDALNHWMLGYLTDSDGPTG